MFMFCARLLCRMFGHVDETSRWEVTDGVIYRIVYCRRCGKATRISMDRNRKKAHK